MYSAWGLESLEPRRLLSAADFDVTFGVGGRSRVDHVLPAFDRMTDAIVTSDEKLLVVGESRGTGDPGMAMVRLHLNGQLDTAFGTEGRVRLPGGSAEDVVELGGGGFLVSRYLSGSGSFSLSRVLENGTPDPAYTGPVLNGIVDLAPTADGGALVLTFSGLARLNSSGNLAPSFGSAGTVTIPSEPGLVQFVPERSLQLTSGSFLIAGRYGPANQQFPALRIYSSTGQLDAGFGTHVLPHDPSADPTLPGFSRDSPVAAVTRSDATGAVHLLLIDQRKRRAGVVRLSGNLTPDASFGFQGTQIVQTPDPSNLSFAGISVDDLGRVYISGNTTASAIDASQFITRLDGAGSLDTSFGDNGYVRDLVPSNQVMEGSALFVSNDQLTLIATTRVKWGPAMSDIHLSGYQTDGQALHSFGQNGRVSIGFTAGHRTSVTGTAVLSDGSIVVGMGPTATGSEEGYRLPVGKVDAQGQLDSSFGDGGSALVDIPNIYSAFTDAVHRVDNDRLVVLGNATYLTPTSSVRRVTAVRLLPDGRLDTTFGENGRIELGYDAEGSSTFILASGVLPTGEIVVAGAWRDGPSGPNRPYMLRLTADGQLDTTFGNGGIVDLSPFTTPFRGLGFQPDGSVILSVSTTGGTRILRVSTAGEVQTIGDIYSATTSRITVSNDGKVWIATLTGSTPRTLTVYRRLPNGAVDETFGGGTGRVVTSNSGVTFENITGVRVVAGNNVVVFGRSSVVAGTYLAAFNSAGLPVTQFGPQGIRTLTFQGATAADTPKDLQSDHLGRLLLIGDTNGVRPDDRDFGAIRLMGFGPALAVTNRSYTLGATQHSMRFEFSEPVIGLTIEDFTLTNLTTGQPVPMDSSWLVAEPIAASIVPQVPLLDGRYQLSLASGSATNATGTLLEPSAPLNFHFFRGDLNRDGVINNLDIAPFVSGLTSPGTFETTFGYRPELLGDVNRDGAFNNLDIAPFVALLTGSRSSVVSPFADGGGRASADRAPLRGGSTVLNADTDTDSMRAADAVLQ